MQRKKPDVDVVLDVLEKAMEKSLVIDATIAELREEKSLVADLLPA